jgi:PAS domain S-box-containing protein
MKLAKFRKYRVNKSGILLFQIFLFILVNQFAVGQITIKSDLIDTDIGRNIQYYFDKSDTLSINSILNNKNLDFKSSHEKYPNFGYIYNKTWLKLEIINETNKYIESYFELAQPWLRSLDLYIVENDTVSSILKSGLIIPFNKRPVQVRNFSFQLNLKPGLNTYYFHIDSKGNTLALISKIFTHEEFYKHRLGTTVILCLFFGLMIGMILYNLSLFFFIKDKNFLLYSLLLFVFSTFIMFYNGIIDFLFRPEFSVILRQLQVVNLNIVIIVMIYFTRSFINTDYFIPKSKLAFNSIIILSSISIILCLIDYIYADYITLIITLLAVITLIITSVKVFRLNYAPVKVYMIGLSTLLIVGLLVPIKSVGLIEENFITIWSLEIAASLTALLFSVSLSNKITFLKKEIEVSHNEVIQLNSDLKKETDIIKAIFNATDETVILVDDSYKIINHNFQFEKYYAYEIKSSTELSIINILPSDIAENRIKMIERVFSTKKSVHFNDENHDRYYENNIYPIFNANNEVILAAIYAKDVTEKRKLENVLENSEKKYRELVNLLPVCVFECDLKGNITFYNKRLLNMFGYQEDEKIENPNIFSYFLKDDLEFVRSKFRSVLDGSPSGNVYKMVKNDGSIIYGSIISSTILNENSIVGLRGVIVDLTEKRKAEQELFDLHSKLQMIISSSPIILFAINKEGIFTLSEGKALSLIGLEPGQVVGLSAFDVYQNDPQIIEGIYNALSGNSINMENFVNGIYFDSWYFPNFDSNNELLGLIGFATDITSKKIAENALRESEEKFRVSFNYAGFGSALIKPDGFFHEVNFALCDIFGYTVNEFKNICICELEIPDENGIFKLDLKNLLEKDIDLYTETLKFRKKNSEIIWILFNCSIFLNSRGEKEYFIAQFIDISLQKSAEDDLRALNEELEARVIERTEELNNTLLHLENSNEELMILNQAVARDTQKLIILNNELMDSEKKLMEINISKDKFFSIIAHDLRGPLGGVRNIIDLLANEYDQISDEEKKTIIKSLDNASKNTFDLLENLLQWSRLQTDRITYEPEIYDFHHTITSTINVLKTTADNKKISLLNKTKERVFAFFDKNMINTVLRNLINNSIKFTNPGGYIIIDSEIIKESNKDFLLVSITDNGIGMDKDNLSNIFRIDVVKSSLGTANEKGTGLGLLLCHDFIKKHNTKLWAESELGKGTKFIFTLPIDIQ